MHQSKSKAHALFVPLLNHWEINYQKICAINVFFVAAFIRGMLRNDIFSQTCHEAEIFSVVWVYNVMIVSLIVVSKETENKWHSMEIAEPLCFPWEYPLAAQLCFLCHLHALNKVFVSSLLFCASFAHLCICTNLTKRWNKWPLLLLPLIYLLTNPMELINKHSFLCVVMTYFVSYFF